LNADIFFVIKINRLIKIEKWGMIKTVKESGS